MVAPVPTPPAHGDSIFADRTWSPQIRDTMRELPSQKAAARGQVFVGAGVREMEVLTPPAALSLLAFTGSVSLMSGSVISDNLTDIDSSKLEAALQLPKVSSTEANQWLRVNSAGDGFELTGETPWHR